jgi:hypothetical protein
MTTSRSTSGHSADVRIQLFVNGHVLKIAQLGPQFLMLDQPVEHPPGDAEILMSVDGKQERWRVHLPGGISPTAPTTPICMPKP